MKILKPNLQKRRIIIKLQKAMQAEFRATPKAGKKITYQGKTFIVLPSVFWPFMDSQPLVENFTLKPGEKVLDVGTGSGLIAIFAAFKGASRVVALDKNPVAVKCAKINAKRHGFSKIIQVRQSDVFSALKNREVFDVITANLPFTDKIAKDAVEATQWDTNFKIHKIFFQQARRYLKPKGRIYLAQANFGAIDKMEKFARAAGLKMRMVGKKSLGKGDPRIFYAFEFRPLSGVLNDKIKKRPIRSWPFGRLAVGVERAGRTRA